MSSLTQRERNGPPPRSSVKENKEWAMTGRIAGAMFAFSVLGLSPALAFHRTVVFRSGQHAQIMNTFNQANQQHNAVINQVQRNIYNEQHTRF